MHTIVDQLLEDDVRLPSPPVIAVRILEIVKADDFSFRELASVIQSEPALLSRILRLANSGFYGLAKKVGTIETAVSAIRKGAYDFIEKPFTADRLILVVQRALEATRLKRENTALKARSSASDDLIGSSAVIGALRASIERVAQTNSRVLIAGPAGSGKEDRKSVV